MTDDATGASDDDSERTEGWGTLPPEAAAAMAERMAPVLRAVAERAAQASSASVSPEAAAVVAGAQGVREAVERLSSQVVSTQAAAEQMAQVLVPALEVLRQRLPDLTGLPGLLQALAERVREVLPPNVHGLRSTDLLRLVEIAEEQRVAVAWVPRREVLRALLEAPDAQGRAGVLRERAEQVLQDCEQALGEVRAPDLVGLASLVGQAVTAVRAGFPGPAQALATVCLDTFLREHLDPDDDRLYRAQVREHRGGRARSPQERVDEATLAAFATYLLMAGTVVAHATYDYDAGDLAASPRQYNRHGSVHGASPVQYGPDNALRAITLATSWLRAAQSGLPAPSAPDGTL